jgi:hypothetical protein
MLLAAVVSSAERAPARVRATIATLALCVVVAGCSSGTPAGRPSAPASSAPGADTGAFIVQLGRDTTSVEKYTRTPTRLEVQQVGRSPRVLQRRLTYDLAGGAVTHVAFVATPVGSTTPTQTVDVTFGPDSVRMQTQSGSAAPQRLALVVPAGAAVVTNASPWSGYETQTMKLVQSKRDTLQTPLWFVGAGSLNSLVVSKVGRDSVALVTDRGDIYHARVDAAGRILGVRPLAGPAQYSVQRVSGLDVDAMAAAYAAREKAGQGLGILSPRDTVRVANVGGAALTVDYSRPSKRGRIVFGGVVPYGEVWRTGANAATQIRTDKALDFGGTVVPAGFYTLWTVPGPNVWKLIVNGETGQWGTAHKPEQDLHTIDMKTQELPEVVERFTIRVDPTPKGGVLAFEWDRTRASADFVVRP